MSVVLLLLLLSSLPTTAPTSVTDVADCVHGLRPNAYAPVPAAAPDSVPTALWRSIVADSNIIAGGPNVGGNVIRDLVYVQFRQGVSQAHRQATIDSIGGEVVGGMHIGGPEFFYAVRVPYCLSAGERTDASIVRANSALRRSQYVHRAVYAYMDPPVSFSRSDT